MRSEIRIEFAFAAWPNLFDQLYSGGPNRALHRIHRRGTQNIVQQSAEWTLVGRIERIGDDLVNFPDFLWNDHDAGRKAFVVRKYVPNLFCSRGNPVSAVIGRPDQADVGPL